MNNVISTTNLNKRRKNHRRVIVTRGGPRAAATSKMEHFVIIVNDFQPLINVAAVLDLRLVTRSILETKFRTLKVTEIFFPKLFSFLPLVALGRICSVSYKQVC